MIAIDRFPERLRMARENAGSETINYAEVDSVLEALKEMTGGRGPDACIMDKFPLGVIMNKGLTVRTAQQHGQQYVPHLLELVAGGQLDPSFLATHHFSLEDAPHAYDMFKHKTDGCVRAVFTPEY